MIKKIKNSKITTKVIAFISIIVIIFTLLYTYDIFITNNSVIALSKYGSRGSEVTQIQTKLKRWGYYSGNIDGIYGTQTVNAVKYFQRKNGLTVDGIAGPNTLRAMGIYSSSSGSSSSKAPDWYITPDIVFGKDELFTLFRTTAATATCPAYGSPLASP